jgi:hypothetical protein
MRDSVVVKKEAVRVMDDFDPSLEGGFGPLGGGRVNHGATGVQESEPFPCVHEADTLGLFSLRRVWHLPFFGPEEEISCPVIEARLLAS